MHVNVGVSMDVDMDMVVHVDLSPSSHFLCSSKDPLEALVSPFMGGGGDPRGWHSGVGTECRRLPYEEIRSTRSPEI